MSTMSTISGRVGADPRLRFTTAGKAAVSLHVATTRRKVDRETNQWVDADVVWWVVSAYGDFAERIMESVGKGDAVIFSGWVILRTYTGADGAEHTVLEMRADHGGLDMRWSDKRLRPSEAVPSSPPGEVHPGQQTIPGTPAPQTFSPAAPPPAPPVPTAPAPPPTAPPTVVPGSGASPLTAPAPSSPYYTDEPPF